MQNYGHLRPGETRAPETEILPDGRKRLTRYFEVTHKSKIPKELDQNFNTVDLGETPISGWDGLRLIAKKITDEVGRPGADTRPLLLLTFEEIDETAETQIGEANITRLEDGRSAFVFEWLQFTIDKDGNANPATPRTVGSSITIGAITVYLLKEEAPDDGCLRRIRRTYVTEGIIATDLETKNNGALLVQSITSVETVPSTPAGYTLVGQPIQNPNGLPIYTYRYAKGTGEVSRDIDYLQSVDQGTTGVTRTTIVYFGTPAVTTNPITAPSGQALISLKVSDEDGFRIWTAIYAKGTGTAETRDQSRADGSFVYYRTTLSATAATPSTPSGSYIVDLAQSQDAGYFVNRAIFIKPPPTVTYRKAGTFEVPGLAYFVGTDLILQPPTTRRLLFLIEVSFGTAQDTTAPFTVNTWGGFTETYIPTASGQPVNRQIGLNGYLCSGTTISGSGTYKGVAVDSYLAQRFASDPTSIPAGATVLDVENEPYLTDLGGTMVFKRTVTSASL